MENNQPNPNQVKPKRSPFLAILPYLLIIAAIAGIVTLFTRNLWNRVTLWSEDELNNTLRLDDGHGYEIIRATATTSYQKTTVSGVAKDNAKNEQYTFQVNISNNEFNSDFSITKEYYDKLSDKGLVYQVTIIEGKEYKYYHYGYKTLFLSKIQYTKDNASTIGVDPDKDVYFYTGDAFQVSWWDSWGPTIIMLIVTVLLAIFLFSRLSKSIGGANSQALSFNQSRAKRIEKSKTKFTDVAGCDEEKNEMQEVVQYLKEPGKFSALGAKLPKGILLVGPPGTGKTLLAKAVAGEAEVPFFSISGSDFVEMFVGVGAGRVRDMFRIAKQSAPCLIFIDEIDAVGRQRGAGLGGGNDEREQTLNQLLVEMDGFADNSGIIVIAATNRDDVLDPALLRAGRFDRQITVSLPDKNGREAIFKVHSRNKKIDPSIDFAALSKRTVGFSGADIENIMNEAAILAVRAKREVIILSDIDEAIDRRIAGPAKKSRSMTETERKTVAYHEAGHAIIGLTLPDSDKVQKITIIPRGQTGGHVLMTPENDRFILTKKELFARIVGYLGGRSSEEVFFNDISTGAHNDIEVATRIARLMVTEYGMSKLGPIQYERDTGSVFLGRDYASSQKNFSVQVAYEIDNEVRSIIDDAHKEAKRIINERKKDVILIAKTLLEHESITAEQIDYLLKNGKLPEVKIPVVKDPLKPIDKPIQEPIGEVPVVEDGKQEVKVNDNVSKKEEVKETKPVTEVKKPVKKVSTNKKTTNNKSKKKAQ